MVARLAMAGALVMSLVPYGRAARNWTYLGAANVDGQKDHDVIAVADGLGRFRALQVRVERAPVQFDHVVVHYGDGSAVPVRVRTVIPAAGQTRAIELPGGVRWVRSVEFYYERASVAGGKPMVQLFGAR